MCTSETLTEKPCGAFATALMGLPSAFLGDLAFFWSHTVVHTPSRVSSSYRRYALGHGKRSVAEASALLASAKSLYRADRATGLTEAIELAEWRVQRHSLAPVVQMLLECQVRTPALCFSFPNSTFHMATEQLIAT